MAKKKHQTQPRQPVDRQPKRGQCGACVYFGSKGEWSDPIDECSGGCICTPPDHRPAPGGVEVAMTACGPPNQKDSITAPSMKFGRIHGVLPTDAEDWLNLCLCEMDAGSWHYHVHGSHPAAGRLNFLPDKSLPAAEGLLLLYRIGPDGSPRQLLAVGTWM